MQIATTLFPVLAMILLGYVLRRREFFSENTVKEIARLVYWVGLPCLLFYKISTATFNLAVCGRIYGVMLTALLVSIAAACLLTAILKIPKESVTAVVQGAFRGNLAFIGLPVIIYSFSNGSVELAESIQAIAVFILALMVITNNVAAVMMFLLHQHTFNRQAVGKILFGMMTNPLLVGTVAGLIAGRFVDQLPILMERTLSGFSQMVLPLALISVGATMANQKSIDHVLPALLASVIKLGLCPAVGFLIGRYLVVLSDDHLRLAMIFMACPTAAASYILAAQMGGDRHLTAMIIVVCTILSFIPLSLIIGLL